MEKPYIDYSKCTTSSTCIDVCPVQVFEKIGESLPELFYDLIGIFIPGFYLYFCLSLIYSQEQLSKIVEVSFLNKTVLAIFIIYFFGHIIYTFSSLFIDRVISLSDVVFIL